MKLQLLIRNSVGHLKTIMIHKYWVFYYACKLGIPWQGFWHDFSKFSLTEFIESVRFYQGGKGSPIPVAKSVQGYSESWQHHKGRNKHHYEYWTDNYDSGTTCIKIPYKYVIELVADYLAAGRTYNGKTFTYNGEYLWWMNCKDNKKMHQDSRDIITYLLNCISINGEKGFEIIKKGESDEIRMYRGTIR